MAKTILIDLDGIVVDILTPWLSEYNSLYQDRLTVADYHTWDLDQVVKPQCGQDIYKIIEQPGFFRYLPAIPGAIPAIQTLRQRGHQVLIVTSPANSASSPGDKIAWCVKNLSLRRQDVILSHRKELVKGDVFIDDSPKNLQRYQTAWPSAQLMTLAYPHNKNLPCANLIRFDGWDKPEEAWAGIVDTIGPA